MKIVLKKATVENFLLYPKCEMYLDDQGLVFLGGSTQDSLCMQSNGSGKSSLLSIISWILWDKPSKDLHDVSRIISYGAEQCVGLLEGTIDGNPFTVRRERSLRGQEISASFASCSRKDDIQKEINNVFGTFELAQNTVLFSQKKAMEFCYSSDQRRRALLEQLLKISSYTEALKSVRSDYAYIKHQIGNIKANIGVLKAQLKTDIYKLSFDNKLQTAQIETEIRIEQENINKLNREYALYKEQIDIVSNELASTLNTEYYRKVQSRDELIVELNKNEISLKELKEKEIELNTKHYMMKNKKCPTCASPVDSNVDHKAQIECILETNKESQKQLSDTIKKLNKQIELVNNIIQTKIDQTADKQRDAIKLSRSIDIIKTNLEQAENNLFRLNKLFNEINNTREMPIDDLVEKQRHINILNDVVTEAEESLPYIKFWEEGFGHNGISSYIVEKSLPVLNHSLNELLSEMTDNQFRVEILPTRLDKKNNVIDELCFKVWDFDNEIYIEDLSEGQQRRVVVCLFLALTDVQHFLTGVSWNVRLIDELFDCLDQIGIERSLRILKRLTDSDKVPTIIVVSHSTGIEDKFDQIWRAFKEDKKTTLVTQGGS